MASRTIKKSLITKQDLALGKGKVVQTRNGINYNLDKLDLVSNISSVQDLAGLVGDYAGEKLAMTGWHPDSDVGGGILYWDADKPKADHNGGTIFSPTVPFGTVANYLDGVGETDPAGSGCWVRKDLNALDPRFFGAYGDGLSDDTQALLRLRLSVIATGLPVHLGVATYNYTDIGNWAIQNLTILGEGIVNSTFRCINPALGNTAFLIWAFESGSPTDQFLQNITLKDFSIEGNSGTLYGLRSYGVARSYYDNIEFSEGDPDNGVAFRFDACSINEFSNLMCSKDFRPGMVNVPQIGLSLDTGFRAGVGLGASTNNIFRNIKMEFTNIGTDLISADQNTFLGGTNESNPSTGIRSSANSRFNTWIGHGLEANGNYDWIDNGEYNKFINCYALGNILMQGKGATIDGGLFERIEADSGSVKSVVTNLTVNYIGGVGGGFIDNGDATEWRNLFDQQAATYIYPLKPRTSITVSASPFVYQNLSRQYQEVVIQAGTISEITRTRNGDTFLCQNTMPNVILLAPNESITVTYSVEPSMSYLPHNGFQG